LVEWCCPLYSSALPSKNRSTYGYAKEYVAVVAEHIRRILENINQFINIAMNKKDKLIQIKNNDLLSKQQKKADKTSFMSLLKTIKKEMISPTYNPILVHPTA
jgi:DNA-binding ferritin-like protein